LNYLHFIDLE